MAALRRFEHRQGNERAAARAMNRLLWPVTMGEMFGTLLSGPDKNVFSATTIKYLRTVFCEHMTGGSPLPALRRRQYPLWRATGGKHYPPGRRKTP